MNNSDEEIETEIESVDQEYGGIFDREISKLKLDASLYVTRYFLKSHKGKYSYVAFVDYINRNPRIRGSDPNHPSYEIEVSKDDNRLIRVSRCR